MQMEYTIPQVIDVAVDSTVITTGPGRVYGVVVNTVLSAHALPLTNNGVAVITLPASMAAGSYLQFPGVYFDHDITLDPNDVATGNVTVFYKPGRYDNAGYIA